MIKTYKITGMTCNGCKASVEKALLSLPYVSTVLVDLKTAKAVVEQSQPIAIDQLQAVLSSKFLIKPFKTLATNTLSENIKSDFRQLFPLFLIFGYISITAVLLNRVAFNFSKIMLDFMGLFYVVFSFFKFLDLKGFPESFKMYDPLAKHIPVYGWIYPFFELILGVLFLMRIQIPFALITTVIILGITTVGVTKALLDKKAIQCACLGTALKLPMTKATFIENTIMLVMAIWMLIKMYN